MTDNLDQDVARGKQAQALLDDPLLTESFDRLRAEYMDAWENKTEPRDTEHRERFWQAVHIVGKVKAHLHSIASSGKLAQREIDDMAGKKPKRFGIV